MKKSIILILLSFLFSINTIEAQNRRVNPVKENYNTILPADIKNQKKSCNNKQKAEKIYHGCNHKKHLTILYSSIVIAVTFNTKFVIL